MLELAAEAEGWIHRELDRKGLHATDEPQLFHERPWSTVLRIPTSAGLLFFFKASAPSLAHEAGLTDTLARLRPDLLPELVAVDRERGWMLMPDGGHTLRSALQEDPRPEPWERILPAYAELQLDMTRHRPALLAAGALDYRLGVLPRLFEALYDDRSSLAVGHPQGLSVAEHERMRATGRVFAEMCERLRALGPDETIHHDDFHDGNIFVSGNGYRFFDWGEGCVAHPFCTMVVCLRSIAYRFHLDADAPELSRLRDIYLEPWSARVSRVDARAAFELAQKIGTLSRALTWDRVLAGVPPEERGEHADAVPGWVQEYLEAVKG